MSIKKILVTGSSGTIGTGLCERLLEKGYEVVGVDIKPNKWNKKINELTILADLRNKEDLKKIPNDVDMVVHLAANARVYNSILDPSLARDNFEMLFNVLEFVRNNNIKRFIFASSREIYGNSDQKVYKEEDVDIRKCESPYAASKIGGESLVYAYNKCYGIDFAIVRFSNVYGKYDESDRVIPLFIKLTKENKDLIIYGENKILDFTYIDDAVEGVIKIIERFDNIKNNIYNIASGKGSSIKEIAQLIKRKMNNKENRIIIKENRIGEVEKYVADISKAKKVLGYTPTTSIEEGIEKAIEWYLKEVYND